MNRILKIGMDVHSTSYTLCAMEPVLGGEDRIFAANCNNKLNIER